MIELLENIAEENLTISAESSELTYSNSGGICGDESLSFGNCCDECDNCYGTSSGCYS